MEKILRLKPGWRAVKAPDGSIYLLDQITSGISKIKNGSEAQYYLLKLLTENTKSLDEVYSFYKKRFPNISYPGFVKGVRQLERLGLLEDVDIEPPSIFKDGELERYPNQISFLSHFGSESNRYELQARIKKSIIVVFGLGGTGSWVSYLLATMGIGTIVGIDGGKVMPSHLGRQALYLPDQVDSFKVDAFGASVKRFNPYVNFIPMRLFLKSKKTADSIISDLVRELKKIDIAVLTFDKPPQRRRRWIHQVLIEHRIPYIVIDGFVGPFWLPDSNTACLRCWENFARKRFLYYGTVYNLLKYRYQWYPTVIFPPNVISSLGVYEIFKFITRISTPLSFNKVINIDLITLKLNFTEISLPVSCPDCGVRNGEKTNI